MGFLFPLYLLGALAIGIPIVLHLRRRPPRDRVEFSSLMFLKPHTPIRKSRSRLENLLLLALRCLAVILLALLFGRPFLRDSSALAEAGEGVLRILLVDRSGSLQRTGLWDASRKAMDQELARTQASDQVAVLAYDSGTETLIDFEEWELWPASGRVLAARERLQALEPGWGGSDLGEALVEAIGLLEDEAGSKLASRRSEIVVVSDWQAGSSLGGLEGFAWPESVVVRRVEAKGPNDAVSNAAVHLVGRASAEDEEQTEEDPVVKVRVTNSARSTRERFQLTWEGAGNEAPKVDVVLPAGGTRVVTAPPRTGGETSLLLTGDDEDYDNRVFVAPPEARPVRILYAGDRIDEQDTGEPLYYLSRALSETESLAPEVGTRRLGELSDGDFEWADVLVLAGNPRDDELPLMETFLESGGILWLPLLERMKAERLPALRNWDVKVREAEVDDYAMWGGLNFRHDLLRPFAPAGLRDFSKIHVWKYREVTFPETMPEGLEVLAEYDRGGPALFQATLGKGRLYVLPAGWLPRDSQLALSSKFVPLLYSMLRQAGFESDAKRQFYVGDPLPEGVEAGKPGVVPWKREEGSSTRVAVNLPVAESELEPLEEGALTVLGLTEAVQKTTGAEAEAGVEDRERLRHAELEDRQQLWRWLLLGAALILLAETWLSGRGPGRSREEAAA